MTEACYKSYHNTFTHIGGERFSVRSNGEVTAGNPAYYILRPEVVESYFYLWRLTKDTKYRDWAWEAAQVSSCYVSTEYIKYITKIMLGDRGALQSKIRICWLAQC